jgi:glycosyltransferase involved in cell wall biosynthesis
VEQYTYALAREQMQRHAVSIFCREYAPHLAEYTVRDEVQAGLPVRRVVNNFRHISDFESHYRNPKIERLFLASLRETRPDLVHFQHCIGLSAGLPAIVRQLGIPFILTLHDYWYICPTTRLLTKAMTICSGPHQGAECGQCLGPAVEVSSFLHWAPFYERIRDSLVPYSWQRKILAWLEGAQPASRSANNPLPQPFIERMRFMRDMLATAPRLLAPSTFCAQVYLSYGAPVDAMRVLPWGLDLERWQHMPAWTPSPVVRFAYIGTLAAHKGVDVLVRAFRRVSAADVELHLFGSGAPNDPFAAQLREAAAGDSRIRLRGRYDNERLPDLLADMDVVVIPSRWHETFSIVTHEALLAGRAVVASRVGAIPEVITDGVNGLLVSPSDKAALAEAMSSLANDRALVERLARAARNTPHTSIQDHACEVESIYLDVIRPLVST